MHTSDQSQVDAIIFCDKSELFDLWLRGLSTPPRVLVFSIKTWTGIKDWSITEDKCSSGLQDLQILVPSWKTLGYTPGVHSGRKIQAHAQLHYRMSLEQERYARPTLLEVFVWLVREAFTCLANRVLPCLRLELSFRLSSVKMAFMDR